MKGLRRLSGRVWLVLFSALLVASVVFGARLLSGSIDAQQAELRQWRGFDAGATDHAVIVARSESEWRQLWQRAGMQAPTNLDEGRQTAVGVFLGQKSLLPQTARIISAAPRDGRLVVVYEELPVQTAAAMAKTATRPWLIVLIERGDLPAVVEQRIGR